MKVVQVKQTLEVMIKQSEIEETPLDHILLYGDYHLTREIFDYLSKERRLPTHRISAPTMKLLGDLAAVLTHLKRGDILLIDEVHLFNEVVFTVLYSAMSDSVLDIVIGKGTAAKNVRLPLHPFTLIASTTQEAHIQRELLGQFSVQFRLDD